VLLFVEERNKFLNFVRSSVRDSDLAEEILHRATLKIISRAASLREPARAEAWIYRLLRNEIADHFRRYAVHRKRTAELPLELPAEPSASTFDRAKLCPCALQELENLHPNYRDALRSVEMEGESIAAHAARKGMSANSGAVRLHRARKSLRARLQTRCGACAGVGCFNCHCAA